MASPQAQDGVGREKVRAKDAFTRLWWLSNTTRPKADNRAVLQEYSAEKKEIVKAKLNAKKQQESQRTTE